MRLNLLSIFVILLLFSSCVYAECGDGLCNYEEFGKCVEDCGICGDNICKGLDPSLCRTDCLEELCGDNVCESIEYYSCHEDCGSCGDGICLYKFDENLICFEDCGSKK